MQQEPTLHKQSSMQRTQNAADTATHAAPKCSKPMSKAPNTWPTNACISICSNHIVAAAPALLWLEQAKPGMAHRHYVSERRKPTLKWATTRATCTPSNTFVPLDKRCCSRNCLLWTLCTVYTSSPATGNSCTAAPDLRIATNCHTAHYWQQYAVSAELKTQRLLTSAAKDAVKTPQDTLSCELDFWLHAWAQASAASGWTSQEGVQLYRHSLELPSTKEQRIELTQHKQPTPLLDISHNSTKPAHMNSTSLPHVLRRCRGEV